MRLPAGGIAGQGLILAIDPHPLTTSLILRRSFPAADIRRVILQSPSCDDDFTARHIKPGGLANSP
jgi:hypothetical protein